MTAFVIYPADYFPTGIDPFYIVLRLYCTVGLIWRGGGCTRSSLGVSTCDVENQQTN